MQLNDYPEVLTVKDIQTILGIGQSKAYGLARSGDFHTIRIGRIGNMIKIPKYTFNQWLYGSHK